MILENLTSEQLFKLATKKAEEEKEVKKKQYRVIIDIYNLKYLVDEISYNVGSGRGSLASVYDAIDREKNKQLLFCKDEIVTLSENYYTSVDGNNSCYYDEINTDLLEEIEKEK